MSKEETSDSVASKASWLLNEGKQDLDEAIIKVGNNRELGPWLTSLLHRYQAAAESCAGSALTQKEAP